MSVGGAIHAERGSIFVAGRALKVFAACSAVNATLAPITSPDPPLIISCTK